MKASNANTWHEEQGRCRGERHHAAKVSDADIRLALQLVEDYQVPVAEVAAKFEVTARAVRYWRRRQRRFGG